MTVTDPVSPIQSSLIIPLVWILYNYMAFIFSPQYIYITFMSIARIL